MTDNDVVRVVVADDNPVIRAGLESVLHASGRVQVCGHASDGRVALDLAERERPDMVLLDVRMPRADGLSVVAPLSRITRVLMLTHSAEDEVVLSALRLGAAGYLVYGFFTSNDLVDAVVGTAAGDVHLSPTVANAVVVAARQAGREPASAVVSSAAPAQPAQGWQIDAGTDPRLAPAGRPEGGATGIDPLSDREREIMEQIARGLTNPEIATAFVLSEKTIKNHINRIYAKLQVTSRGQAIARWLGVEDSPSARDRSPGDSGQASVAMVFLAAMILAGGVLLFQYSRAADLGTRARTAADAAALAAAGDIRDQFEALLARGVPPVAAVALLDDSRDVAADYAAANGAALTDYAQSGLAVRVAVQTQARLDSRPVMDTGDRPGVSAAEAVVELDVDCEVVPPAPEPRDDLDTDLDTDTGPEPPAALSPWIPPVPGSVLHCDGEDVLVWNQSGFVDLTQFMPLRVRLVD